MSTAPPPVAEAGLVASALALLRELPGLVSDRVELLSLELRRALSALVQMTVLVVAAAILGVTAWLAMWAIAVYGLVLLGMHTIVALLVVLLLNVTVAGWAVYRARSLLERVSLPATRRHLTLSPSPQPEGTSGDHPAARAPGAVAG